MYHYFEVLKPISMDIKVTFLDILKHFDTVGWAAGRVSGLQ